MWQEIRKYGQKLVAYGLNHSHFGNISVRLGNKLFITKSGSLLDEIDEQMVVGVPLEKAADFDANASTETVVHRKIYLKTTAGAVIHVHSPFVTIESMLSNSSVLVPKDTESKYFMHEIPIVTGEAGSLELAENVAEAIVNHKVVIAKGHGSFAAGRSLEETYINVCSAEHICMLKYFYELKMTMPPLFK